ncbi:MAG: Hsp20/alpha crystallin family protein [Acidobacteria bacterium]|nr:MAG: Hsp20/alpha crystallin family protein [Acidobacteriota bacterium]
MLPVMRSFGTDLLADMRGLFRRMEREFEDLFGRVGRTGGARAQLTSGEPADLPFWTGFPPVDVWMEGDRLQLVADLPGVDPANVDVTVQGGQLVIRGHRPFVEEKEGRSFLLSERGGFRFERRFDLPDGVDADKVQASYRDGVLFVTLPVSEAALPKKVPIKIEHGGRKKLAA